MALMSWYNLVYANEKIYFAATILVAISHLRSHLFMGLHGVERA